LLRIGRNYAFNPLGTSTAAIPSGLTLPEFEGPPNSFY